MIADILSWLVWLAGGAGTLGVLLAIAYFVPPLRRYAIAAAALLIGLAILLLRVFHAGRAAEREKAMRQSLDNLRARAAKDDEVRSLPADRKRGRLDRWVRDD